MLTSDEHLTTLENITTQKQKVPELKLQKLKERDIMKTKKVEEREINKKRREEAKEARRVAKEHEVAKKAMKKNQRKRGELSYLVLQLWRKICTLLCHCVWKIQCHLVVTEAYCMQAVPPQVVHPLNGNPYFCSSHLHSSLLLILLGGVDHECRIHHRWESSLVKTLQNRDVDRDELESRQ